MDPTQELIDAIREQTRLLAAMHRYEISWKNRLMIGVMTGLGSTVGVSLVLALSAYILKPFADNIVVRTVIERPGR